MDHVRHVLADVDGHDVGTFSGQTDGVAPTLAAIGLALGDYLLMSRFGLLSGAVAEGVDPTTTQWGLSPLGWVLALLPFAVFVAGYAFARGQKADAALVRDFLA